MEIYTSNNKPPTLMNAMLHAIQTDDKMEKSSFNNT